MGAFGAIRLLSHSPGQGKVVQLLVKLAEARSVGRTDVTEVSSVAGKTQAFESVDTIDAGGSIQTGAGVALVKVCKRSRAAVRGGRSSSVRRRTAGWVEVSHLGM